MRFSFNLAHGQSISNATSFCGTRPARSEEYQRPPDAPQATLYNLSESIITSTFFALYNPVGLM